MSELQKNSKFNTIRTLEDISSKERQIRYKRNVPFVHIPYELLAQCSQIDTLLDYQYFQEIWTNDQLNALKYLQELYRKMRRILPKELPDVPDIFENNEWNEFMKKAGEILTFFQTN